MLSVKSAVIDAFGDEDVSAKLWGLIYSLGGCGIILIPCGIWGAFNLPRSYWWEDILAVVIGGLMLARAFIMYEKNEVDIPASPVAHIALLKIWGVLLPIIFRASVVMSEPAYPLKIGYVQIPITPKKVTLPFDNVTCIASTAQAGDAPTHVSAGGSVNIEVVAFTQVNSTDGTETIKFVECGGQDTVTAALTTRIDQVVRHVASLYDYQTFQFMKGQLAVMLLVEIAKIDLHQLLVGADGLILDSEFDISLDEYRSRPKIRNVVKRLFPEAAGGEPITDPVEKERVAQEIDIFLKLTKEPYLESDMGYGFVIRQFDVTHIQGVAALQEEANLAAAEELQRQRELQDARTNVDRAMVYVNASGGEMKFADALEQVLAEKGVIDAIAIRGSGNPSTDLTAVLGRNHQK